MCREQHVLERSNSLEPMAHSSVERHRESRFSLEGGLAQGPAGYLIFVCFSLRGFFFGTAVFDGLATEEEKGPSARKWPGGILGPGSGAPDGANDLHGADLRRSRLSQVSFFFFEVREVERRKRCIHGNEMIKRSLSSKTFSKAWSFDQSSKCFLRNGFASS